MAGTAMAATRGHHTRRGRARAGAAGDSAAETAAAGAATTGSAIASTRLRRSGGGSDLRDAVGERRRDGLGLAQAAAAALALGQVHDDALLVLGGERAQGVARDQLVDVFHSSSGLIPTAASASRRAFIAANVRLFTVPMGTASRSASSDCVYPAK